MRGASRKWKSLKRETLLKKCPFGTIGNNLCNLSRIKAVLKPRRFFSVVALSEKAPLKLTLSVARLRVQQMI